MPHREIARENWEEEGIVMERGRDAASVWSEPSPHWMETVPAGTRTEPKVIGKTTESINTTFALTSHFVVMFFFFFFFDIMRDNTIALLWTVNLDLKQLEITGST